MKLIWSVELTTTPWSSLLFFPLRRIFPVMTRLAESLPVKSNKLQLSFNSFFVFLLITKSHLKIYKGGRIKDDGWREVYTLISVLFIKTWHLSLTQPQRPAHEGGLFKFIQGDQCFIFLLMWNFLTLPAWPDLNMCVKHL